MVRKKKTEHRIVLPERLDAVGIDTVLQSATAARGGALLVDAGPLRYVGVQGVQILLSVSKTWQRDGVPMRLTSAGVELRYVLSVLGIVPTLLYIDEATK